MITTVALDSYIGAQRIHAHFTICFRAAITAKPIFPDDLDF